jgi:hypothetical protein
MKELFILIAHLLTTLVRLAQSGGVRSVVAQSLALGHQLLVLQRRRKRAPRLAPWDRLFFSLYSLWLSPNRRTKISIVPRPSTFVPFHQALVRYKYRLLYAYKAPSKAGAEGPLGRAYCRRGGDEAPKSELRRSENRSADFVCLRRRTKLWMLAGWRTRCGAHKSCVARI